MSTKCIIIEYFWMYANFADLFAVEIHPSKILEKPKHFNSLKVTQTQTFQFVFKQHFATIFGGFFTIAAHSFSSENQNILQQV